MTLKKTAGRVLRLGIGLYLAGYLAVSGHVGYDFIKHNLPRIEQRQTVQILKVNKYKLNVNGKEKYLTLAGENHFYNQTEYETAIKLVDEHQHFADECGSDAFENISCKNSLYTLAVGIPFKITSFYSHLGNGRWYYSIDDIAEDRGYKVHALEDPDDPFDNMSRGEKIRLFGIAMYSALIAPLYYYDAKKEKPFDQKRIDNFRFKDSLVDKRDITMANGIINLLQKEEIDKLLVSIGRGHLEGVIKSLSQQLTLDEL